MPPTDADLGRSFDRCLATAARRVDRVIAASFDEALRPLGVKATQVTLLASIAALGDPRTGAAPRDLAPALQIDQTTLSRNLARLEDAGLVARRPAADARLVPVALTPAGRALLRRAHPLWAQANRRARERLGPHLAEALLAVADQLTG